MSVLVDTNVLLRRLQAGHPSQAIAAASVKHCLQEFVLVAIIPQIVAESWNVATRPTGSNGLGLSCPAVDREIDAIERALTLLPDSPLIYAEWKRLVIRHNVIGAKVHDTRLVAAMNVHGVRSILTFNDRDFRRYGVSVLHPATIPQDNPP